MTDKYDDYYDSESQHASALAAWERARFEGQQRRRLGYVEEPTGVDKNPLDNAFVMIVLSALALFAVCMTIYHVMLPSFYWVMGQIGRLIGDGPAVFLGSCLWLSTFIVSLIKSTPGAALYSGYHWIVIFTLINAVATMRAMISPWGG